MVSIIEVGQICKFCKKKKTTQSWHIFNILSENFNIKTCRFNFTGLFMNFFNKEYSIKITKTFHKYNCYLKSRQVVDKKFL